MSDSKSRIIEILKKFGELPQSELVRISGLSKSRLSEILSELEKQGLIERKKSLGKNLSVKLSNKFIKIGIIRAAEYPFIIPFVKALKEKGFFVDILIYDNGLSLTKDLVEGKINIGFSPVVTQLIFKKIFNNFDIIGGGAKGGGGIIGESLCDRVGSTTMSSMEIWSLLYNPDLNLQSYDSPESMVADLENHKINAISIWEPYFTILIRKGYPILHTFEPLHCCTLAVRNELDKDLIKKVYEESFTSFLFQKDRWVIDYANLLGINYSILSDSVKNYVFDYYLDLNEIRRNLRKIGILGI
ncbi:MarR family transcriptional regulator [Sulfurisphaera ohwakuensis]|uniref:MarR family transcriptional regulator n=1 Tax=Sulfurisphaera ohwakuensis TaxID=69656 RepID=UPI0036F3E7E3